ncbi:MAG: response regulator [Caldithrix sp.]|nr:response regulator [Caldithrix sp.]
MTDQNKKKPKILVIDDLWPNIQIISKPLEKEGYEIDYSLSGKEGIEKATNNHPDLILLDLMMPKMSGHEVCEKLKANEQTKDIPVIFLTAKVSEEDLVKGFNLGAVDYIIKPFRAPELLVRARTHIELKQSQEALQKSLIDLENSQQRIVELEKKNSVLAMVATANHELNQPLTVLKANLELFLQSISPHEFSENEQKYLKKIQKAIDNIQRILQKYRESFSFRFEKYMDQTEMVIFDDELES